MKGLLPFVLLLFLSCETSTTVFDGNWGLGPFVRADNSNPVLVPMDTTSFFCPVRTDTVAWETKDVFNPATVVRNDTIFMIYRAEDTVGVHNGTSRLGLAWSLNGLEFERLSKPVFFPDNDSMKKYEWEGGVEDPRVILSDNGQYIMTYTAYDGKTARLCVASSNDLLVWEKHGLAFPNHEDLWSKSGSIVGKWENGSIVATKIKGKYWMYWGDTDIFLATSEDLLDWEPVYDPSNELKPILSPRAGMFDSRLVEPGPPAIVTEDGILLLYNSMNLDEGGDPDLPAGNYAASQALFSGDDPSVLIARKSDYFLSPERDYEKTGQIGNVCFVEGLSILQKKYFLYYGTADSKIAVTIAPEF